MKAIGKYRVLDEIGSSAAGKLYRARDAFRNREVALRVYDSSAAPTPAAKDQFCRELGACADLRHPHIAGIVDVGEADGVIYVATELLTGVDLRRHFQDHRVLPLNAKLELMAQVCDGLAAAHGRGMAHGNLKPRNLFLVAADDIRILDLGTGRWLASILAAGGRLPELAVHHLAPEQILGEFFDTRADIFSVGLILYQLLVDKYPFPVPDALVTRDIVHAEPEPLRRLDPQIPEELEQLVARALNKDPQLRLRAADQFAAALRAIAQPAAPKPVSVVAKLELPASIPALVQLPAPQAPPPAAPPPPTKPVVATPAAATPAAPTPVAAIPVAAIPAAAKPAPVRPASAKPAAPKRASFRKGVVTYTVAAILALGIAGSFLSRKGMHASPAPAPVAAPVEQPKPVERSKPVEIPARPAPPPSDPAPAAAVNPQPSEEQVQLGSVKSLWQSGKYAQAMGLVNEILAKNPYSAPARSWKKKIRAAQDAEADMK